MKNAILNKIEKNSKKKNKIDKKKKMKKIE